MSDYTKNIGERLYTLMFDFVLGLVAATVSIGFGGLILLLMMLLSSHRPLSVWTYVECAAASLVALGTFISRWGVGAGETVLIAFLRKSDDPKLKRILQSARDTIFKEDLKRFQHKAEVEAFEFLAKRNQEMTDEARNGPSKPQEKIMTNEELNAKITELEKIISDK